MFKCKFRLPHFNRLAIVSFDLRLCMAQYVFRVGNICTNLSISFLYRLAIESLVCFKLNLTQYFLRIVSQYYLSSISSSMNAAF